MYTQLPALYELWSEAVTPCCSTCRFFTEVKRNGTVLRFRCPAYGDCRAGKEGAGHYEYSYYTERAWERWVRERKT